MSVEGMNIAYKMTKEKLKVREWAYFGTTSVIELIDPKINEANSVSHALIVSTNNPDKNSVILWFIGTEQKYRRQGYARKLIKYLQEFFDEILTQWTTEESAGLMRSCGFQEIEKGLSWKKETKTDEHSVEDGASGPDPKQSDPLP